MSWIPKAKIPQQEEEGDIVTPDVFQILVGAGQDLVLIFREAFSNWTTKGKNASGDWGLRTKNDIPEWNLKGKNDPGIWDTKTKNNAGSWSKKTKIPS